MTSDTTSEQTYDLPVPRPTVVTQPFWEAAKRHELMMQRCRSGDHLFFYPREYCPVCLSEDLEWVTLTGKGRVYSYTIVHRPANPRFESRVPYVYAVIQLDEGPRMISNVVECDVEDVRVDMSVTAHYDDVTDEVTLVKFKPLDR